MRCSVLHVDQGVEVSENPAGLEAGHHGHAHDAITLSLALRGYSVIQSLRGLAPVGTFGWTEESSLAPAPGGGNGGG